MRQLSFTIIEGKVLAVANLMVADSVVKGWSVQKGFSDHRCAWAEDVNNLKELVDACILDVAVHLSRTPSDQAEVIFLIREYQNCAPGKGIDSKAPDLCDAFDDRCDELLTRYIKTNSFLSGN